MKNKINLLSRLGIPAITVAALFFIGNAVAQTPRNYPPLKSGGSDYGKATPTPKPSASASATASNQKKKGNLSSKDKTFMMNAAKGGTMEVEWGKVAAQKGQNADVKKFGNRMVADHTRANNELMALANAQGVQLPTTKPNTKWKSDKEYMDMMVKDHEKDLAEFQAEAQQGQDADLKKFADKTSKVVKKHLDMAKEIDGKLK